MAAQKRKSEDDEEYEPSKGPKRQRRGRARTNPNIDQHEDEQPEIGPSTQTTRQREIGTDAKKTKDKASRSKTAKKQPKKCPSTPPDYNITLNRLHHPYNQPHNGTNLRFRLYVDIQGRITKCLAGPGERAQC